jgi:hypothetical protein
LYWGFTRTGLLPASFNLAIIPELYNMCSDEIPDIGKPLVVTSADMMPRKMQENVVKFIQKGGKTMIVPVVPTVDENYIPCTILKDFLFNMENKKIAIRDYKVRTCDDKLLVGTILDPQVFSAKFDNTNAIPLVVEEFTNETVGYEFNFENGAKVIWLGFTWSFYDKSQSDLLKKMLERLEIKPLIECDNTRLWCVLRENENKKMLFVMNLFTGDLNANIKVHTDQGIKELGRVVVPAMSVERIEIK